MEMSARSGAKCAFTEESAHLPLYRTALTDPWLHSTDRFHIKLVILTDFHKIIYTNRRFLPHTNNVRANELAAFENFLVMFDEMSNDLKQPQFTL